MECEHVLLYKALQKFWMSPAQFQHWEVRKVTQRTTFTVKNFSVRHIGNFSAHRKAPVKPIPSELTSCSTEISVITVSRP